MASFQNFLLVDTDANTRVLYVATLLRVFPQAAVVEVQDIETALSLTKARHYDLIIAHRANSVDPHVLIKGLRESDSTVPILGISGINRTKEMLAAGANRFLNSDEWLMVGKVAQEMISPPPTSDSKVPL